MKNLPTPINQKDLQDLTQAKKLLEDVGFAIKVANYLGRPIEFGLKKLDSDLINRASKLALEKSLDIALSTIDKDIKSPSNTKHKFLATLSGAMGGFFGMNALVIELPVSTTIMLRSIADIAKSQGHNLNLAETKLACLEVFSLGSSKTTDDDGSESGYYAIRSTLAYEMKLAIKAVEGMSKKAIKQAIIKGEMPILVKLIESIASRFGVTVSQKVVAEAIPIIGAVGGGGINYLFMSHFQQMATGHFIIKRLEKRYGSQNIEIAYRNIVIN